MKTYILYQDWRTFQTRNVLPNEKVLSKFAGYIELDSEDIPYKEGYDTHILLDNKLNIVYEFVKRNQNEDVEKLTAQIDLLSDALNEAMELFVGGVE